MMGLILSNVATRCLARPIRPPLVEIVQRRRGVEEMGGRDHALPQGHDLRYVCSGAGGPRPFDGEQEMHARDVARVAHADRYVGMLLVEQALGHDGGLVGAAALGGHRHHSDAVGAGLHGLLKGLQIFPSAGVGGRRQDVGGRQIVEEFGVVNLGVFEHAALAVDVVADHLDIELFDQFRQDASARVGDYGHAAHAFTPLPVSSLLFPVRSRLLRSRPSSCRTHGAVWPARAGGGLRRS